MGGLENLSEILKGSNNSTCPRLMQVEYEIQNQQVCYINYDPSWQAYILPTKLTLMAVLWQSGALLWLYYLFHQPWIFILKQ